MPVPGVGYLAGIVDGAGGLGRAAHSRPLPERASGGSGQVAGVTGDVYGSTGER
ncbi:hypothetical protein [Streptomyces sp. MMBL 11-1]|uniref:hypothetical protein n=1 Tax=Streptomyces sp. MMBL 11-1 TaxID=3026420 RepID=UPI00235DDEBA|nr:hypothetical protein [Streptomyces sp. MMBL 11-1]